MNSPTVYHLGCVEYADGLELQQRFQNARKENQVSDTLLLLEHPAVLTLGRGAKRQNLLASDATLQHLGVEVHETDRGGDVTYHGPGQIVGYPLLYLPPGKQDVRKYVRNIEEVMIRVCARFGIQAGREEKWPGVWVNRKKIAALGVHLSRWYTRHGFALNVNPNLEHFSLIVPCGIREAGVTSMSEELGRTLTVSEVEPVVASVFSEVFGIDLAPAPPFFQTVNVVVRKGDKTLLLLRPADTGGFWQTVTGHVEPNETPADAALREAREETGLLIEQLRSLDYVHAFAGKGTEVMREHAFVCDAKGDVKLAEHDAFEWLDAKDSIERVPFAGLKAAIRKSYR